MEKVMEKVVLGKDGKPMMAARRVQFDASKGEGSLDDSVTFMNASTLIRCDSRTTFQCLSGEIAKAQTGVMKLEKKK
nr:hypothetical protein [Tanacetum cinerariifolium]